MLGGEFLNSTDRRDRYRSEPLLLTRLSLCRNQSSGQWETSLRSNPAQRHFGVCPPLRLSNSSLPNAGNLAEFIGDQDTLFSSTSEKEQMSREHEQPVE